MKIANQESVSPAIRALGSLFNLTNVFLQDDGSKETRRGSSLPKHIIFKYDDDDEVAEDDSRDGRINSKMDGEGRADSDVELHGEDISIENNDFGQEMSALGLPLSFQISNKKKNEATKGKRKRTGIKTSFSGEIMQDGLAKAKTNIVLEEHKCDESPADILSSDGNALENCGSCITAELPQSSVAESSDMFAYNEDNNCHCTGSFGEWTAIWDSYYVRNYFYNVETQESTWYPPPGMEHLALGTISNEPNADIIGEDHDHAISSHGSDVTCKRSLGECGTAVQLLDQPDVAAERLSSGVRVSVACNCVVKGNESGVLDRDCFDPSQPCSYIPNQSLDLDDHMKQVAKTITESACDELLVTQMDKEGMRTIAGELESLDNKGKSTSSKRKKKARKSRSRKKALNNRPEQLFQCTVDAYYSGIGKYWCQRYILFSKFDQGIKMDEEGWYSVTPECIARHQASRCGSGVIIDCFAGVGGNAIQFAKMGRRVIAVDIDPKKIEYAKHNAAIYGVGGQIDFLIGDSISLASKLKADTIFMSPPWGGPGYSKLQTYDMAMLKPCNGQFLFDTFKEAASMIVMFLPRNIDLNQLAELCLSAYPHWSVDVEKNFLNGKFKAVTAYFSKVSLCNV